MTLLWKGWVAAHYVGDTAALVASLLPLDWLPPVVRCMRWRPIRGMPDRRFVEVWV